MKTLTTLIKLHKQQLDALRRSMSALETSKAKFLHSIENLKEELERETKLAQESADMGRFFGDFAKAIRLKEETYRADIAKLDTQMEELREEIRLKFSELKKFEIAREHRLSDEKATKTRREGEQLDEIAAQQFMRKQEP